MCSIENNPILTLASDIVSFIDFLPSNVFRFGTIAICISLVLRNFIQPILPTVRIEELKRSLEDIQQTLDDAAEQGLLLDHNSLDAARLSLKKFQIEHSNLLAETVRRATWRWMEYVAFFKGLSFAIMRCQQRVDHLRVMVILTTEKERRDGYKADIERTALADRCPPLTPQPPKPIARPSTCIIAIHHMND